MYIVMILLSGSKELRSVVEYIYSHFHARLIDKLLADFLNTWIILYSAQILSPLARVKVSYEVLS
jgi:hypothetical protein